MAFAFDDLNQFSFPQIVDAVLNLKLTDLVRVDEWMFPVERAVNFRTGEWSRLPINKAAHRAGDAALFEYEIGDCPDSLIVH